MEWSGYLLKVIACQACFLLVYQLLQKPSGRHGWSRGFLWCMIILSFAAPVLDVQVQMEQPLPIYILEEEVVFPFEQVIKEVRHQSNSANSGMKSSTTMLLILGVYFMVTVVLIVKFFMNLKVIFSQIKKLPYDKLKGINLYETNDLAPFSFFKAIFIPRELKAKNGYSQIIEHEVAHARHWHSLDRILIDLIVALLWFNPFIYWYRNALKAVHEYQADEYVLRRFPDKIAYQEILYLQLFKPALGLVNHFNTSLIKKRIVMMNQKRINIYRWLPLLSIPAILCLSLAFSMREVKEPMENVLHHHLNLGPVANLWPTLNVPQEGSIPEISPIRASDMTRLSSAFGMRMDPRTKTRKHHQGVDFSAPIGTAVYATADGVIITAEDRPKGFGTIVEISHGEEGKYVTRYAHLDAFLVEKGQKVKKGDLIARVGNSGWSRGPHLHYEVRIDGKSVNPEKYIKDLDVN